MEANQLLAAGYVSETDPEGADAYGDFVLSLMLGGMTKAPSARQFLGETYGIRYVGDQAWVPPGAIRSYKFVREVVLAAKPPVEQDPAVLQVVTMADALMAAQVGKGRPDFAESLAVAYRLGGVAGMLALIERGDV